MTCGVNETLTDLGCIPTDPVGFVGKFYGIGLALLGLVSFIFLLYGGYIVMTSRGNPTQLERGKKHILYSIFGLLFAIFGVAFLELVSVNILRVPGFGH